MPGMINRLPNSILADTRGFKRRSSGGLTVRVRENNLGRPRFKVVVGTKFDRRSSERNKFKRRVSEFLRSRAAGIDVIVNLLPPAKEMTAKALVAELGEMIKQ